VAVELRGRSVLVTGGSRGLGAALGAEVARRGGRVVLVARGEEALLATVKAIRRGGGEAHGLVADQGKKDAVYPLVGAAAALVGPIDILVLNASTLGPTQLRELSETECEDFAHVLEVNLLGPFRIAKAVVGSMLLRRRGLVVGISSDAATAGYPGWGAYGVSKAALDQLLRTWAAEHRGGGVRFLSVDPGEMDTAMHAAAMPEADRSSLRSPLEMAVRIAELMEASESLPSGGRLDASRILAG
jgi:NAD(P)-dependent dehydrogenase (short-subunit alcohol dehydrogenase family)